MADQYLDIAYEQYYNLFKLYKKFENKKLLCCSISKNKEGTRIHISSISQPLVHRQLNKIKDLHPMYLSQRSRLR